MAASGSNVEMADLWNQASGRTWVELQEILDGMFAPLGAPLLEVLPAGAGGQVVDVGCGAGATSLAMARRLGPGGAVLGVDVSGPLVEAARARAAAEGLPQVTFVHADAQTHALPAGRFDALISRLGVMFFADPVAAFANLRRGLRAGGRLAFVAWRRPEDNPFMMAALRAAAPFLPEVSEPVADAPGQFGFADAARVRRILEASGWSDVALAPLDLPGELREADLLTYATRVGPVGRALRDLDEGTRVRTTDAVRAAYAPYVQGGVARFGMAVWLATARA